MDLKYLAKKYFKLFSDKNEKKLFEMFDKKITLSDWEIRVSGKKKVCKANRDIFSKVKNIRVKPINIYNEKNTIIAELRINVNKKIILHVVDIITFNKNKKIISIKAFKM